LDWFYDDEDENNIHKSCVSIPNIKDSNENQMATCTGKEVGESCRVYCKSNFHPTTEEINCVLKGPSTAEWDSKGVHCFPTVDCRDHHNNVVDWFIAYILNPKGSQEQKNDIIPIEDINFEELIIGEDQSFLFKSSRTPENVSWYENTAAGSDWLHATFKSLQYTLAPIKNYKDEQLSEDDDPQLEYFVYNDQSVHPDDNANAKGSPQFDFIRKVYYI